MAGVTDTGFTPKLQTTTVAEVQARQRSLIDEGLTFGTNDPITNINDPIVEQITQLWEALEAINNNQDPAQAINFGLDIICSYTGTTRAAATPSTVDLDLDLDLGTALTGGSSRVRHADDADVVFALVDDYTAVADGVVSLRFESVGTGPIEAAANTLTVIDTPTAGWNTANNPADANPGQDVELDSPLRQRRKLEVATPGGPSLPSIISRLSRLQAETALSSFFVRNNRGLVTDVNGLPPHSIEAVVIDGDDAEIAAALFAVVGASAGLFGNTSVEVTDSVGNPHPVRFTRPVDFPVYLEVQLQRSAGYEGDDAAKQAIVDWAESVLAPGVDFNYFAAVGAATCLTGVTGVEAVASGASPSPTEANNVAIGSRQRARLPAANITVTSIPTP